jgi:Region found in RelA / SpoT proteins
MTWITRQYSKRTIDRAGKVLVADNPAADREATLEIVNNWRSCHAFPLNTMQISLRNLARQVDEQPIIAQRIKRLSSIDLKLRRFPTMTLSQMQDLGGCRAIVSDLPKVLKLAELFRRSRMKHKLHTLDNYIERPQQSGYRGVHLIYRYFSDRSQTYNGQKIEIQLRSAQQHSWATAVETVGTFTRHALKSSIGPDQWLRFFALMGTVMAIREGSNHVDETPEDSATLLTELRGIADRLDVVNRLAACGAALQKFNSDTTRDAHYFLVQLDPEQQRTLVMGFKAGELRQANAQYLELEKRISAESLMDTVLVSVEHVTLLQRAYPNYFLDTRAFVDVVQEALAATRIRRRRKTSERQFALT